MPRKQISKKNNKNRKLKKKNKHSKKKTKTKKKVINRKIKTRKNKKKYLDRNKQVGGADLDYSYEQKQKLIEKHIQGFETVFADQIGFIKDIEFNLCYLRKKNPSDFDILIEQLKYGEDFYRSLITEDRRKETLSGFFNLFLEGLKDTIRIEKHIIERDGYRLRIKDPEHKYIRINYNDFPTFNIYFYIRTLEQREQQERSDESTYNNSLEIIIKPDVSNQDLLEELCAILLGNTVFWYVRDNGFEEDNCSQIIDDLAFSQSQSQLFLQTQPEDEATEPQTLPESEPPTQSQGVYVTEPEFEVEVEKLKRFISDETDRLKAMLPKEEQINEIPREEKKLPELYLEKRFSYERRFSG